MGDVGETCGECGHVHLGHTYCFEFQNAAPRHCWCSHPRKLLKCPGTGIPVVFCACEACLAAQRCGDTQVAQHLCTCERCARKRNAQVTR